MSLRIISTLLLVPLLAFADEGAARVHFARGASLYEAGDYQGAIGEFEAARREAPLPAFTYNLGRCHEQLGHREAAIAEYQRYLATSSDPAEARDVQSRIAALQPPAPRPPAKLRIAAIVLGAVAVAALAAGTGSYLAAREDYSRLQQTCRLRQCGPPDWTEMLRRADAGYALWAIGGAVAATDVALWVLDSRARRASRRAWLVPSLGGVAVAGSF